LTAESQRVLVTVRELLEGMDSERDGRPFVLDEAGMRAAHRAAVTKSESSPVLYRATRDVVAPQVIESRELGTLTWRMDSVEFAGGLVPGSLEISRSIGHWNPYDQWEIFEVVSGEVFMVVNARDSNGPVVHACPPDSVLALAPGAWHLTYAVGESAVVENIYCRSVQRHPPTIGEDAVDKYFTRPALPFGLWLDGADVGGFEPAPGRAGSLRRVSVTPVGVKRRRRGGLLREVMAGRHPDALSEPVGFWPQYVTGGRFETTVGDR
jgi:oxalate decarboxylase/phosphoglucose isomerase-like protein (cupin superfamily)